jgi:hypothetical protein
MATSTDAQIAEKSEGIFANAVELISQTPLKALIAIKKKEGLTSFSSNSTLRASLKEEWLDY